MPVDLTLEDFGAPPVLNRLDFKLEDFDQPSPAAFSLEDFESKPPISDIFTRSVSRGVDQLKQMGYGALGAFGATIPRVAETVRRLEQIPGMGGALGEALRSTAAGEAAMESPETTASVLKGLAFQGISETQKELEANPPTVPSYKTVTGAPLTQMPSLAGRYIVERIGEQIPVLGASIVTAGAASVPMEIGTIYADIWQRTGQSRPDEAIAFGTAAGALDATSTIGIMLRPLTRLLGRAGTQQVVDSLVKRIGKEAAKNVLLEAPTEAMQTVIERSATAKVDPNTRVLSDEGVEDIINSAIAGGLVGGTFGVVGGIPRPRARLTATDQQRKQPIVPPVIEQPVTQLQREAPLRAATAEELRDIESEVQRAKAIPEDQTQLPPPGQVGQRIEAPGRDDLQQAQPGQSEPVGAREAQETRLPATVVPPISTTEPSATPPPPERQVTEARPGAGPTVPTAATAPPQGVALPSGLEAGRAATGAAKPSPKLTTEDMAYEPPEGGTAPFGKTRYQWFKHPERGYVVIDLKFAGESYPANNKAEAVKRALELNVALPESERYLPGKSAPELITAAPGEVKPPELPGALPVGTTVRRSVLGDLHQVWVRLPERPEVNVGAIETRPEIATGSGAIKAAESYWRFHDLINKGKSRSEAQAIINREYALEREKESLKQPAEPTPVPTKVVEVKAERERRGVAESPSREAQRLTGSNLTFEDFLSPDQKEALASENVLWRDRQDKISNLEVLKASAPTPYERLKIERKIRGFQKLQKQSAERIDNISRAAKASYEANVAVPGEAKAVEAKAGQERKQLTIPAPPSAPTEPTAGQSSVSKPPTQQVAPEVIQRVVAEIRAKYPAMPAVRVVESQTWSTAQGAPIRGFTDAQGNVYLNRAMLGDEQAVRLVLAHELGHWALEQDVDYRQVMDALGRQVSDADLAKIASDYRLDLADPAQRRTAVVEYAQERFERLSESRLWDRVWHLIADIINRAFGTTLGEADLRRLLANAERLLTGTATHRLVPRGGGPAFRASNAVVYPPWSRKPQGRAAVTAYHGTPHDVDRFSTAKIGTGEGGGAYGWGIYAADLLEVAEDYRNRLATLGVGQPQGNTYTVSLNVEPEDLLDWDKPLSEQSEKVKAVLEQLGFDRESSRGWGYDGAALYQYLSGYRDQENMPHAVRKQVGPDAASQKLASLGLKGIRYLDQGSRQAGFTVRSSNGWSKSYSDRGTAELAKESEVAAGRTATVTPDPQTYNYVIFDDKDITITHRNGQTVALASVMPELPTEGRASVVPPGEGIKTQIGGKANRILVTSATASAADVDAGVESAQAKFEQIGEPVFLNDEGWLEMSLGHGGPSRQANGIKLVAALEEAVAEMGALAQAGTANDRNVRFIDSVRKNMVRMRELLDQPGGRAAYEESTVNDLLSLAQGVPSEIGRILRLFQTTADQSFFTTIKNAPIALRTWLGEQFNGPLVRKILRRAMTAFPDLFTQAEIDAITASNPELAAAWNMVLARTERERGGYVYRVAQAKLRPEVKHTLKWLEENAKRKEAVAQIIQNFIKMGGKMPVRAKQGLTPLQQLVLLADPETVPLLDAAIAEAVRQAERNAARSMFIEETKPSDEEIAAYDARTTDPQLEGPDPTEGQIDKGFNLPAYAHWRVIRDNLLGYSPVTDALLRKVIKGDFKGTKFDPVDPQAPKPSDTRINLVALAKQPDAEVKRVFDAYIANLGSEIDRATPLMRMRIEAMARTELAAQLNRIRADVVRGFLKTPEALALTPGLTPEQQTAQTEALKAKLLGLVNAGALNTDALITEAAKRNPFQRFLPKLGDIVKQTLATPFYKHSQTAERFANRLAEEFPSIDPGLRDKLVEAFRRAFELKIKASARRAAEASLKALSPSERRDIPEGKQLWRKLLDAVNAKGFDELDVLRGMYEGRGVRIKDSDIARLKTLGEREQRLRTDLPAAAITKIGLTQDQIETFDRSGQGLTEDEVEKLEDARIALSQATKSERMSIHKEMTSIWARMTVPLLGDRGRNIVRAINDFSPINLLTRWTFATVQGIDVATQLFSHTWLTAAGHASLRYNALPTDEKDVARWFIEYAKSMRQTWRTAWNVRGAGIAGLRAGIRGRGLPTRIEGIETTTHIVDRLALRADELLRSEDWAKQLMGALAWIGSRAWFGIRISGALDAYQQSSARFKEFDSAIRTWMRTEMEFNSAEAELYRDFIIGDINSELALAAAEAPLLLSGSGIKETAGGVKLAAWNIVFGRMLKRAEKAGLPAHEIEDAINRRLQTLAWNNPEQSLIGRALRTPARSIQEAFAKAYIPTAGLTTFATAAAYALTMKLQYGLAGFAPGIFTGSPTVETALDKAHVRAKAAVGLAFGAPLFLLAATGVIKTILRWPDDRDEREKMKNLGLKPGVALIPVGDGRYRTTSLSAGPLSLFSSYLALGGAYYKLGQDRAKKQAKLEAEAADKGLQAGPMPDVTLPEMLSVAAAPFRDLFSGTRTLSGRAGAFTDYGEVIGNKAIAGYISSFMPAAPLWQNSMRIAGVEIDPRLAENMLDIVWPTPSSGAQRINKLGDRVNDQRDLTDLLSLFTRGTGKLVDEPAMVASRSAYATAIASGYVPPDISPGKAYNFGGTWRQMTTEERQRYVLQAGQTYKKELAQIDAGGLDEEQLHKAAQEAFARANAAALAQMGVTPLVAGRVTTGGRLPGLGVRQSAVGRRVRLPGLRGMRAPSLRRGYGMRTRVKAPKFKALRFKAPKFAKRRRGRGFGRRSQPMLA